SVAHDRKLGQVLRLTLRVCSNVEQQGRLRRFRRNHRSECWSINTGQSADDHLRGRHRRARVARRDKTIATSVHHQLRTNPQRAFLLPSHGSGDWIVHRNDFSRIYQLNTAVAVATPTAAAQLRLNLVRLAHKDDADAE